MPVFVTTAIVADVGDRDFYIPRTEMIFLPAGPMDGDNALSLSLSLIYV